MQDSSDPVSNRKHHCSRAVIHKPLRRGMTEHWQVNTAHCKRQIASDKMTAGAPSENKRTLNAQLSASSQPNLLSSYRSIIPHVTSPDQVRSPGKHKGYYCSVTAEVRGLLRVPLCLCVSHARCQPLVFNSSASAVGHSECSGRVISSSMASAGERPANRTDATPDMIGSST